MPRVASVLPAEPDATLLDKLARVERALLTAAIVLFALNLAASILVLAGLRLPGSYHLMSVQAALAALFCALSQRFSNTRYSAPVRLLALLPAALVALACTGMTGRFLLHLPREISGAGGSVSALASSLPAAMPIEAAAAFALLGWIMMLMRAQARAASITADLLTFSLLLLLLILVSMRIFAASGDFSTAAPSRLPWAALFGLLILTAAVFLRKAQAGAFSILLRPGIGGKIARGLSPLLLALPYLRECLRARFLQVRALPPEASTAMVASLAVMISIALLLFLSWRIHSMEVKIHDLSLRDALTGLYNVRGFQLLAEQALRMARRTHLPFSVLYVDLDDLKRTNDTLGHQAGSELLMETANLLKLSFRETDVVGRIGGDEFAVAGQFSRPGIALAAHRIEEAAARRNTEGGFPAALSFSLGHVTSEAPLQESLDELLAMADRAMYEEKRRKKVPVA